VGLLLFAGLMSGLTIGLLTFEELDLEVIERTGDLPEQKMASEIKTLIANRHLLLVTLVICNAGAMETLPMLLDELMHPFMAVVLSVTGVLFFGEILPQAVCKSFGLSVGAAAAPVVRFLMLFCSPVAWPIAKLLDCTFGSDSHFYKRKQMAAVVEIHRERGEITEDEAVVIEGALEMARKRCSSCFTPMDQVCKLAADAKLDDATMDWMLDTGFSRLPIHAVGDEHVLLGQLLMKRLIKLRPEDATPVSELALAPMVHVCKDILLYDLLDIFQMGRSHMAAVYDNEDQISEVSAPPEGARAIGVITLEDVIEELIKEDINDETDTCIGHKCKGSFQQALRKLSNDTTRSPPRSRLASAASAASLQRD